MTSRREFFQKLLIIPGVIPVISFIQSCTGSKSEKTVKGKIVGASAAKGHLLRDRKLGKPDILISKEIVIVGGGISGLSAANYLINNKKEDLLIIELEKEAGGNSSSGHNEIGSYPWGAHYLPLPNLSNKELIDFLKENDIITHFDNNGIPYFDDYYLCHDPESRLYIHGQWQNGIIPSLGVPALDRKEIERFLHDMEELKTKKGKDGKYIFDIPLDNSSTDNEYTRLDDITMYDYLVQNNYRSEYLHWYINYSCRDDFGTDYKQTSAWAGLHYFASRKGKASNAESSSVLTWPEGNGFLTNLLKKKLNGKIKSDCLVYSIQANAIGVTIDYLDTVSNQLVRIEAQKCIVATPQFINKRLLHDIASRTEEGYSSFTYAPWMVANITTSAHEERSGRPLSWDNVIYNSKSLGYINSQHQNIHRKISKKVFTYYVPLSEGNPVNERMSAYTKQHSEWTEFIINDLIKVYPKFSETVENIDVWVWGHGMIRPTPGFISGQHRKDFQKHFDNKIFFAHSDLSGVSIFEEAFHQGIRAAKETLQG